MLRFSTSNKQVDLLNLLLDMELGTPLLPSPLPLEMDLRLALNPHFKIDPCLGLLINAL